MCNEKYSCLYANTCAHIRRRLYAHICTYLHLRQTKKLNIETNLTYFVVHRTESMTYRATYNFSPSSFSCAPCSCQLLGKNYFSQTEFQHRSPLLTISRLIPLNWTCYLRASCTPDVFLYYRLFHDHTLFGCFFELSKENRSHGKCGPTVGVLKEYFPRNNKTMGRWWEDDG